MIPLVIGMSGLRPLPFLFYSTATGLLWAGSVSLTGYLIGRILGLSVETFEHHLLYVVLGFASFGTLIGYSIKLVVNRQMNADHHSTPAAVSRGRGTEL
jgi:membrane protein DedA with SNARE-associated domain